jgi:7-carboxy-7-deazaguanine synthase
VLEILSRVVSYQCSLVEITGGEPLIQRKTADLAAAIIEKDCKVLVETNGTQDISVLPQEAIRIMDIKCPSSGESDKMRWENILELRPEDEIKFVISNRHDYEWVKKTLFEKLADTKAGILFSTVFGELHPRHLAHWMLTDNIQARLQLQIHKYIWTPDARGV